MSTVITHPATDVVVLGMGVMGGEISVKLTLAGIKVVGIEKGPYWDYSQDFAINKYDEWGVQLLGKFDNPLPMTSNTIRNNIDQMALPIRRNTTGQSTHAGFGVGGAAHHYGANFGRFDPWVYAINSNTVSKYGQSYLDTAAPMGDIIDFPLTYDDYLAYYQDFEMGWGVSGTNQEPVCPNSTYPLPPHPTTPLGTAFQNAAESLGINNWPNPTAIASQPYTNQYGVQVNACVYDGYCSCTSYACETGAKANSAVRTVPAAINTGNLDLRTNCYAYRIDTDPTTGLATQVEYIDGMGNINIQPASVVAVTMWGFYTPWMMMMSSIGTQYNPTTVTGSMGRGPHEPTGAPTRTATGPIKIGMNNTVWAGNGAGGGYSTYDFADDNFDHTNVPVPYIGGTRNTYGSYASAPGLLAVGAAGSAANIGSKYKATLLNKTQVISQNVTAAGAGMQLPMTVHYFDLDPMYTDLYGDPIPRYTTDYAPNSANASNDSVRLWSPVVAKMGVTVTTGAAVTPGTAHEASWGIHIRGGCRIGLEPSTSALNQWQQIWSGALNVFAAGEDTEPIGSNTQTGGTHPAAVTSHAAADGIQMYLKSPGALA
jgi:gluconate 2-dehydrogenase alpha chain